MKHILPTDLVNKVLNFLAGRPYSEVATLISDIQKNAVAYQEPVAPACEPKVEPIIAE